MKANERRGRARAPERDGGKSGFPGFASGALWLLVTLFTLAHLPGCGDSADSTSDAGSSTRGLETGGPPSSEGSQPDSNLGPGLSMPAGAKVVRKSAPMKIKINGTDVESLPKTVALTADAVTETVSYFTKSLKGWLYEDVLGTHVFWQGKAGENPLAVITAVNRPYVVVEANEVPDSKVPDARTKITISCKPTG